MVLAHDHDVGLGEAGAHALVGLAGAQAAVEVELLAERDVHGAEAGPDRRRDRGLDRDLVAPDRLDHPVGERGALALVDVGAGLLPFPLELDAGCLEHAPRGLGQLRPGAVSAV